MPIPKTGVAYGQQPGTYLGNYIHVRYEYGSNFWGVKNVGWGATISRVGKVSGILAIYGLAWSIIAASNDERIQQQQEGGVR